MQYAQAQKIRDILTKVGNQLQSTTYTGGFGWNVVDDSGQPWGPKFDAKRSWNCPGYPTSFSMEGYYKKGFSFGFEFNYNNYRYGKLINGDTHTSSNFFSYDANAKYNFFEQYHVSGTPGKGYKELFDVFGVAGIGVTYRHTFNVHTVATLNLGFGANVWVYKNWGIQLQAQSKFALTSPFFKTPANYLQYNWGLIYKFKLKNNGVDKTHRMIIS
jgi:OOP family OmpA-OmpF porin